jgi:hypothetical protein
MVRNTASELGNLQLRVRTGISEALFLTDGFKELNPALPDPELPLVIAISLPESRQSQVIRRPTQ